MARRTARKSRKRRRRSRRSRRRRGGGPGVAANASEVNFNEKPVDVADDAAPVEEAPAEAQEGGKRKRRRRKGRKSKRGGGCGLTEEQTGGKRRKTKKKGGKRKLNAFFKAMLSAKKSKAKSFSYKGKTYVGKKHHRLGMIYSKKK
jgi:hypothetical protein